jgi:hypothetical protein
MALLGRNRARGTYLHLGRLSETVSWASTFPEAATSRRLQPVTLPKILLSASGCLAKVMSDYVTDSQKTGGTRNGGQVAVSRHLVEGHPYDSAHHEEHEGDVTYRYGRRP